MRFPPPPRATFIGASQCGVRPCVVALILATAVTMGLQTLLGVAAASGGASPDCRAVAIFALIAALDFASRKLRRKPVPPIALILIAAGLGMAAYGLSA